MTEANFVKEIALLFRPASLTYRVSTRRRTNVINVGVLSLQLPCFSVDYNNLENVRGKAAVGIWFYRHSHIFALNAI